MSFSTASGSGSGRSWRTARRPRRNLIRAASVSDSVWVVIAVLTLRVIDPELTVDYLTNWQIPYEALPDRRVLVPAEQASGAALEFTAAP